MQHMIPAPGTRIEAARVEPGMVIGIVAGRVQLYDAKIDICGVERQHDSVILTAGNGAVVKIGWLDLVTVRGYFNPED